MALRVALLGYGTGGAVFHAPLIAAVPGLELSAVVTGDAGRRREVERRYPGAKVLEKAVRVWERAGEYDLAVVTVPNRMHVPLARAALMAGLPVVVDKPVAATAAEARALGDLAAERGLHVIPFHNRRWDGDFLTVRSLVEQGDLGRILRMESRFERWRPQPKQSWKESSDPADAGGIHYDLGSHLVDQALVAFGPVREVHAEIEVRRPEAVSADEMFLSLLHDGGIRSHLWASAVAADPGPRFRVLGDGGAYTVHGLDGQEDALRAGGGPGDAGWGRADPSRYGTVGTPGSVTAQPTMPGAYQDFYAGVVACLRDGAAPPVVLADAVAGLEVIEAAVTSARERRLVVL
jgi:predicted dehydrogenase